LVEFKKALKLSTGECFECYYNIGVVYALMNKIDNAVIEWEKAVELEPKNLDVHFNLVQGYRLQGRFKEAIKEYETILKFNPNEKRAKPILDKFV
jgi:tetratricopeptide (TPR) repeat protein